MKLFKLAVGCILTNERYYNDIPQDITYKIDKLFSTGKDVEINDIQKIITPILDKYDIFISYYHNEENKAKRLYSTIKKYYPDYKIFLDTLFWGNIYVAADKWNKKYSRSINGKLEYEKIRKTEAVFNIMLANSLFEVIRNSKVFIYIPNSDESFTESPWIFLENYFARYISLNRDKNIDFVIEDLIKKPCLLFELDLTKFKDLNSIKDTLKDIK